MDYIENIHNNIFYRAAGTRLNRHTIIMIHGLAGDSRFFHNQFRHLNDQYRIIAPDLPGHGKSPAIDKQSIEQYNISVEAVIDHENIDRYILLGHSMGGSVCLENYSRNKNRVKAMILVSTSASIPIDEKLIDSSINDFSLFIKKTLPVVFNNKSGIFVHSARKNMNPSEQQTITRDLLLCRTIDYNSLLNEIEIPVLIIANRYDRIVPLALSQELHSGIKNSQFIIFEGKGHVPFFENHEEFNSIIRDFTASIQ